MRGITPRRYRLDPTGSSPNNKVVGEPRHIGFENINRVFQPRAGAFFVESMQIFDAQTHQLLTLDQDYKCIHLDVENATKFGQPIAYMVVITNTSISPDIYADYQAVGGMGSYLVPVINQLIPMLEYDNRVLSWTRILNKPPSFNPGHHYHDVGDFYGFEYMILMLMEISKLITAKDIDSHISINALITVVENEFAARWADFMNDINAHIGRTDNPHQDNIADIDTYSKTSFDQLLAQKLDKLGTAINASKIYGSTWSTIYNSIRQNYDAAALGAGTFSGDRLGINYAWNSVPQVLTTNGWKSISSFTVSSDPIYAGDSTFANVKATFQSYPVGTRVNWIESGWNAFPYVLPEPTPWIPYHVIKNGPGYEDWAFV